MEAAAGRCSAETKRASTAEYQSFAESSRKPELSVGDATSNGSATNPTLCRNGLERIEL